MDPLSLVPLEVPAWGPVTLRDGGVVRLRRIRPDDAARLRRMFYRLSADTLYLRFFDRIEQPDEAALRYLAEIDHSDRLAVVATDGDEIVGVARCDRLAPGDEVAEVAVVVEDARQGRGLGRLLLARLGADAYERGIRYFEATMLPENGVALGLAASVPGIVLQPQDEEIWARIPLWVVSAEARSA